MKKNIFIVVLVVLLTIGVVIVNQQFRSFDKQLDEESHTAKELIQGELKHATGSMDNPLLNFTETENQLIFDVFDIKIPDGEDDIEVRIFCKNENEWTGTFYLELVGIKDRERLYKENKDSPDNRLGISPFWSETDENGNYTYYFSFSVIFKYGRDYQSDYITSISNLYDELSESRKDS